MTTEAQGRRPSGRGIVVLRVRRQTILVDLPERAGRLLRIDGPTEHGDRTMTVTTYPPGASPVVQALPIPLGRERHVVRVGRLAVALTAAGRPQRIGIQAPPECNVYRPKGRRKPARQEIGPKEAAGGQGSPAVTTHYVDRPNGTPTPPRPA